MAQQPLLDQGLLIGEASRSHSDTPLGRTPLDELSAPRKNLYLTVLNTDNRQAFMSPPPWDSNPQSQQASGRWD